MADRAASDVYKLLQTRYTELEPALILGCSTSNVTPGSRSKVLVSLVGAILTTVRPLTDVEKGLICHSLRLGYSKTFSTPSRLSSERTRSPRLCSARELATLRLGRRAEITVANPTLPYSVRSS